MSALLIDACRLPETTVAGLREFKRVVKWRISPVFVAWRISDVRTEDRSTRRSSAIASRIKLRDSRRTGRTQFSARAANIIAGTRRGSPPLHQFARGNRFVDNAEGV